MAEKYFRTIPDFDYVNRTKSGQNISDYTQVKNIFKRGKLREDIFEDLTFFTKYQIKGDMRPDEVAYDEYGDENLDWVVMLSNNIVNLATEWPWTQEAFDNYLNNKYGSTEKIYETRHHETNLIQDSNKRTIVPAGLIVPSNFSLTFFDEGLNQMITRSSVFPVSNYTHELRIQDAKRNIFLLKPIYVGLVIEDQQDFMPYTPGSSQYVSDRLVRGENIRLYN
tara:strand:+ start:95 stop:763 length:669 start_codon:yes stop_codon:yes gene_type:complete